MAVDDLRLLRDNLPELFAPEIFSADWEGEWVVLADNGAESDIPIDVLDTLTDAGQIPPLEALHGDVSGLSGSNAQMAGVLVPTSSLAGIIEAGRPGNLVVSWNAGEYPPPDALAFYVPFHYSRHYWGIYLIIEGIHVLGKFIFDYSRNVLSWKEAHIAAKAFLYGHEYYHHRIESFATRLEVAHRDKCYIAGFEKLYQEQFGWGYSMEEALATVNGIHLGQRPFSKVTAKRDAVRDALLYYIKKLPQNYSSAAGLLATQRRKAEEFDLCENSLRECFSQLAKQQPLPSIWRNFPMGTRGVGDIRSRTKYLIHRNSPLLARIPANLRFLRRRELIGKLKALKCTLFGKGSKHAELYTHANAARPFPIGNHTGDYGKDLIMRILRQAGISMNWEEFLRVKAE